MNSRISVGIVLALVFAVSLILGGVPLFLLMLFVACYSAFEMWRICRKIDHDFSLSITLITCVAFILDAFVFKGKYTEIILIFAMVISFISAMLKEKQVTYLLYRVSLNVFTTIYCGWTFSKFILMREMGMEIAIFTLLLIWSNDIFCLIVGKSIGKTKLAPHISPKKTVEGAIGGIVLTPILGVLYKFLMVSWNLSGFTLSYGTVILVSILMSILGQIGDLGESAIKRQADVKDSGTLLKGHGGVLDRFDSFVLTVPVVYYLYVFLS